MTMSRTRRVINISRRLLLCVVVQGGAGRADPGTDEEGRQLIQPVGAEAAG